MSFSKGGFKSQSSPCRHYIEYKAGENKWRCWIKGEGDQEGHEVDVDMSNFAVLDDNLMTLHGFSNKLGEVYLWSNEVRSINDPLTVKYRQGKVIHTLYEEMPWTEIKEDVPKYCTKSPFNASVYVLLPESAFGIQSDNWVLANFKINGTPLSAWFNFRDSSRGNFTKQFACVTGSVKREPKNKEQKPWYEPVFEMGDALPDHIIQFCMEEDQQLQEYLAEYLKNPAPNDGVDQTSGFNAEDEVQYTPEEQEEMKQAATASKEEREAEPDQKWGSEDEPVNETEPADMNNTDAWRDYVIDAEGFPANLGKCSLDQLNEAKNMLEEAGFDGSDEIYNMVIRGIADTMKEEKQKDKNPFTKKKKNPLAD